MNDIFNSLAGLVGLDPATLVAFLTITVTLCNLLGRAIPDTAVGPLGIVRKVAKVLGLYLGNRVAPGVSANTAALGVIGFRGLTNTLEAASGVKDAAVRGAAVGESVQETLDMILHPSRRPSAPPQPGEEQGGVVPEDRRTDPFRAGAEAGFKEPAVSTKRTSTSTPRSPATPTRGK